MARRAAPKKYSARGANLVRDMRAFARSEIADAKEEAWPKKQYQKDPVGFVREVLGEKPMRHQRRIMRAVSRDVRARVVVRSGQKTGKTKLVIWLALWFYCSFPEAVVCMTANSKEQIKRVLWKELGATIRHARAKCGLDIEEPALDPATGLRSLNGRYVFAFTVRDVEALSGISGANMLVIVDEGSALEQHVAEAIEGNMAGDGRWIMISNPTRTEGPFFDAFMGPAKDSWTREHLSSETIAQDLAALGKRIPGVATLETINTWKDKYGEESPFYRVRVLGDFLLNETGKIISLHAITQSALRWEGISDGDGILQIGVDPAGPGDQGDRYAFAVVRGKKLLALFAVHGLEEEAAIVQLRGYVATYRRGDETPRVVLDREGSIGASLFGRLKAIGANLQKHQPAKAFEVFGVKASLPAMREPEVYSMLRDEVWARLSRWIDEGGAICPDVELEQELHAPDWEGANKGKLAAMGKKKLREKLGRSPDKADALGLAVWEPASWLREVKEDVIEDPEVEVGVSMGDIDGGFDAYANTGPGGFGDPYRY